LIDVDLSIDRKISNQSIEKLRSESIQIPEKSKNPVSVNFFFFQYASLQKQRNKYKS
jgi:hypothetical protein